MNDYKITLNLSATDCKIYDSLINHIPNWWTEMFEGISNQQGETFTVRFGHSVYKTMLVEELIPNKKIVWLVLDSLIDIPELKNKTEWIKTKIMWEISASNDNTILNLTHIGLTPKIECYTICEAGWQNFTKSLSDFIVLGAGTPFKNS